MIDPVILRTPVEEEEVQDQEDFLESICLAQKAFFDRTRFQYQGDTWISKELWEIHHLLNLAHERLANLRATKCFS